MKTIKDTKGYKQGVKDWKAGMRFSGNPYNHGSRAAYLWSEGWQDKADAAFMKIIAKIPSLLKGS